MGGGLGNLVGNKVRVRCKIVAMESKPFWQVTAEMYKPVISKPRMTEALLLRPPVRFLFDIIMELMNVTGFAKGLYTPEELDRGILDSRGPRLQFLQKMIDYVWQQLGRNLAVSATKIIAGKEPEQTNDFLQAMCIAATSGSCLSSTAALPIPQPMPMPFDGTPPNTVSKSAVNLEDDKGTALTTRAPSDLNCSITVWQPTFIQSAKSAFALHGTNCAAVAATVHQDLDRKYPLLGWAVVVYVPDAAASKGVRTCCYPEEFKRGETVLGIEAYSVCGSSKVEHVFEATANTSLVTPIARSGTVNVEGVVAALGVNLLLAGEGNVVSWDLWLEKILPHTKYYLLKCRKGAFIGRCCNDDYFICQCGNLIYACFRQY